MDTSTHDGHLHGAPRYGRPGISWQPTGDVGTPGWGLEGIPDSNQKIKVIDERRLVGVTGLTVVTKS